MFIFRSENMWAENRKNHRKLFEQGHSLSRVFRSTTPTGLFCFTERGVYRQRDHAVVKQKLKYYPEPSCVVIDNYKHDKKCTSTRLTFGFCKLQVRDYQLLSARALHLKSSGLYYFTLQVAKFELITTDIFYSDKFVIT